MYRSVTLATISLHQMPGAGANIIRLANYLTEQGMGVSLITFDLPGAKPFYPLDSKAELHCLGEQAPHGSIGFLERCRMIKKIYQLLNAGNESSTLICFHHGILFRFIFAAWAARAKLICSERNALEMYEYISPPKWGVNFCLMSLVDRITVQFPEYISSYPTLMRKKISVVPNPVEQVFRMPNIAERDKIIISVGRFEHQKQFNLLVRI